MTLKPFTGNFTQQESLDDDVVAAATAVLKSGRLHRYNSGAGEISKASELEQTYARYQGARFCLACASGGYAMAIALRAAGIKPGETVLTNGFTLAPVPGAIASAGGKPVLVEITENLVIDLEDLELKARSSGARFLLLSNMRGHLADMERLSDIMRRHRMILIEDCAHTMGAAWNGRKSGNFGLAGCFSTQTYKHLNSGEGGLLTSDDPDFMARAIILSGSYMLYERHGAAPPPEVFERIRLETPNMSGRMDNLRAAILLPQLLRLEDNIDRWNERYRAVENGLNGIDGLVLRRRPDAERYVGSSIQFGLPGISRSGAVSFVAAAKALGVELKWFGAPDPVAFTSNHHSWRYVDPQALPETDRVLSSLFDMRLPLTFSVKECRQIASIIAHCVSTLPAPCT
ncbi:MAG: aminotransferase class I/II-fold pyridoxal phosphate-dependent enzyme [Hoeflea sp.]|uniref:DegT/DnrJ/EryC1/StrS family aminotransferase n=1 Tax=Hoeflea sp. TaxID=1940281 RepID=UPI00329A33CD